MNYLDILFSEHCRHINYGSDFTIARNCKQSKVNYTGSQARMKEYNFFIKYQQSQPINHLTVDHSIASHFTSVNTTCLNWESLTSVNLVIFQDIEGFACFNCN